MTPRSLFNIILKVLGLLVIKEILETILQLIQLIYWFKHPDPASPTEATFTLISSLLFLGYEIILFYYLVFKTGKVIDFLRLDKGFEQETIPVDIHLPTILSISIIVTGSFLIVYQLPDFFRQLFLYFDQKSMGFATSGYEISYAVSAGARTILGVLLITFRNSIVNLIVRRRK